MLGPGQQHFIGIFDDFHRLARSFAAIPFGRKVGLSPFPPRPHLVRIGSIEADREHLTILYRDRDGDI